MVIVKGYWRTIRIGTFRQISEVQWIRGHLRHYPINGHSRPTNGVAHRRP